LGQRELARERFSRSEYTMLSYVAAVGALYLGDIQLMRQYVDEGTVAGQPSSSLNIFYGALFALEAGLAHYSGQTRLRDNLQREAATRLPSIGPGIGMSADFLDATIRLSDQPEEFASAVEATVDRSLELGYRLGAVQTAALSLTIRWNDRIAEAFLRAFTIAAIPAYASTAEGVRLIAQRDLPGLHAWGATLSPDRDDAEMLVRVLGAAYRSARREELPLAEVLERILSTVLQRRTETIATGEIAQLLSSRELQVGRLGGELSNTEIAERLSISRRTVENHIANGLKKTGLANRKELARLLQSL
jgi:DNA-binding CsgD family transcriptional regulator